MLFRSYYKIKVCWEQDKTFSGKIQHRPKMRRSLPAADSDPPKKSPSAAARHTSSRSRSTRRHESAAVRPANCGTVETREISYNKEQAVDDVDGLFRTRSRDRTGTAITGHRILSPACLPIPPSGQRSVRNDAKVGKNFRIQIGRASCRERV